MIKDEMRELEYVNPDELKPDPHQPRKEFDDEFIEKLASTFESQDMIEPVEVDERNVIVLGEQRWRAAKLKGLKKIPVLRKTGLSQGKRLERQLIDDTQRKELNEMERAWAYGTAIININTGKDYTIDDVKAMEKRGIVNLLNPPKTENGDYDKGGTSELAKRLGMNQKTVWGYLQLLYLEPETQQMIGSGEGEIPFTYGRNIARVKEHPEVQKQFESVIREDFKEYPEDKQKRRYPTVHDVEEAVKVINEPDLKLTREDKEMIVSKTVDLDTAKEIVAVPVKDREELRDFVIKNELTKDKVIEAKERASHMERIFEDLKDDEVKTKLEQEYLPKKYEPSVLSQLEIDILKEKRLWVGKPKFEAELVLILERLEAFATKYPQRTITFEWKGIKGEIEQARKKLEEAFEEDNLMHWVFIVKV